MNKDKTILHLCADTGSDSEPYRKAGYNVCIGSDIGVEKYHPPENVQFVLKNLHKRFLKAINKEVP